MIFQINKIISVTIILTLLLSACSNHTEGDGHNHGTAETKSEAKKVSGVGGLSEYRNQSCGSVSRYHFNPLVPKAIFFIQF